jgi:hypothetical protein
MSKTRLACFAYCVILTLLLLVPDPTMGLRPFRGIGAGIGVHFTAFGILGILVAASRLPLRRVLLSGLLFTYAMGVELLQYFVPLRGVEARDLLENLLGLLAGIALWQLVARWRVLTGKDTVPEKERFRVLTPEGLVTFDTFVLAEKQPLAIRKGCALLVQEAGGRQITVHQTRLVPVAAPGMPAPDPQGRSPCFKCGKVEGIVADQVVCPYHGQASCGILESKT